MLKHSMIQPSTDRFYIFFNLVNSKLFQSSYFLFATITTEAVKKISANHKPYAADISFAVCASQAIIFLTILLTFFTVLKKAWTLTKTEPAFAQ